MVRRQSGLELPRAERRRFGIRRHFRVKPWSPLVEVHWADGAEAYVTPVAGDEVGIACLWRGDGSGFDDLLAQFPALRARLRGAEPTSAVLGAGPFARARACHRGRVALVGDAAGALDPLTGEGITVGLLSAQSLATVLARGDALNAYARCRRRLLAVPRALAGLLLFAADRPRVRHGFVRTIARHPALFDRLVALNAGEALRARARARAPISAPSADRGAP
jgi:flavin-dependent dehydrogenase